MKEPFRLMDPSFFTIDLHKNNSQLVAGFTNRSGGVSKFPYDSNNFGFHVGDIDLAVVQNRQKLANKIGFPVESFVGCEQTHETMVKRITSYDKGKGALSYTTSVKATDGIYTSESNVLLTLCFADCLPLFFYTKDGSMVGIAHAGWKGTVHQIGEAMVNQWINSGIQAEDIFVVIGPSICKNCYVVDEFVIKYINDLLAVNKISRKPYVKLKDNQYSLDLQSVNEQLLINSGIRQSNISITQYCTSCHNELFFSHRKNKGKTGRMLGFIGIREANEVDC